MHLCLARICELLRILVRGRLQVSASFRSFVLAILTSERLYLNGSARFI